MDVLSWVSEFIWDKKSMVFKSICEEMAIWSVRESPCHKELNQDVLGTLIEEEAVGKPISNKH